MVIVESDWKIFRKLRERALERFCQRILDECRAVAGGDSGTPHERYIALSRHVHKRNRDIARMFDEPRRSDAILQILGMYAEGLFSGDEFSEFSEELQARVRGLLEDD